MNPSNKIDYVEIPSRDIKKSKDFFQKLFGWKFTDFGENYTSFEDGRLRGGFYPSKQVASTEKGSVLVVFDSPTLEALEK